LGQVGSHSCFGVAFLRVLVMCRRLLFRAPLLVEVVAMLVCVRIVPLVRSTPPFLWENKKSSRSAIGGCHRADGPVFLVFGNKDCGRSHYTRQSRRCRRSGRRAIW
jgi:hypothetical protein